MYEEKCLKMNIVVQEMQIKITIWNVALLAGKLKLKRLKTTRTIKWPIWLI